jgi:hypothetical protein
LDVVKLPLTKPGVVLLPRRWIVKHNFVRMSHFRRLACDDECLAETLAGLQVVASAVLLMCRFITFMVQCAQHALIKNLDF